MVRPEQEDLLDVLAPSKPLYAPSLDPKQGWACPNPLCKADRHTILAVDSQLEVYNNVKLQCATCGYEGTLTQELEQENREEAERLCARVVREMNGGSTSKVNGARNFELAKFSAPETAASEDSASTELAAVGGLRTVQEPSDAALRAFAAAYKALTGKDSKSGILTNSVSTSSNTEEYLHTNHRRSSVHHLVRGLEQAAFDEAVNHKHWVFALERSIELNHILDDVYIGYHPVKAVQNYYTCKIANLLANLLLEESTVEIEESDDSDEDHFGDSDDERDLATLKSEMTASASKVKAGHGSMQDMLSRRGRTDAEDDNNKQSVKKQRQQQRRSQAENSKRVLQFLKELVPKLEDSSILQQFRICWGTDGRLASRYRHQVDSLKQALHYAELPFAKSEQE